MFLMWFVLEKVWKVWQRGAESQTWTETPNQSEGQTI